MMSSQLQVRGRTLISISFRQHCRVIRKSRAFVPSSYIKMDEEIYML
jgi:hypothetical protein